MYMCMYEGLKLLCFATLRKCLMQTDVIGHCNALLKLVF